MSYSQLPADIVFNACNRYVEARKARVLRERTELIDSHVGERRWFGFGKPATREEVEAEYADELSWIKITGGYWYNQILELQSLANVAAKCNTLVTVNAELAHLLEPHFG